MLAVVDIGSNSLRLFLCEAIRDGRPEGERITTVTSLRRGAGPDGSLAEDAVARLDACLEGYGARMRAAGATRGVALGTSAVRDAPDRSPVAESVARRLGLPLTVLTGRQEAALAYRGARVDEPGDDPVTVVDVGGASTELVRGDAADPRAVSLQLGGVRSSEAFLHSDPPSSRELAALRDVVRTEVVAGLAAIGWDTAAPDTVVGVAGTITTLAAIDHGGYDPAAVHGCVLTRDRIDAITAMLAALPLAERRRVPGLGPERAPMIVGGAVVTAVVLELAGVDRLRVSERDLLDGAALEADALAAPIRPGRPALVAPATVS